MEVFNFVVVVVVVKWYKYRKNKKWVKSSLVYSAAGSGQNYNVRDRNSLIY